MPTRATPDQAPSRPACVDEKMYDTKKPTKPNSYDTSIEPINANQLPTASPSTTTSASTDTITLVGAGQGLQLTVAGGDQGFPFCNSNDDDAARHYYCGA